jgi:hypothetical protein
MEPPILEGPSSAGESGLRVDTIVEAIEVFVETERCLGDAVLDPIFPVIRQPIENSGLSAIDSGAVRERTLLAHMLPLSLNSNGW